MGLVYEVFEAVVTRAFTIAVCDDATSFADDYIPPLTRFFYRSRPAGSFVVKNDFVSAAKRTPKTDADFIEVNLKHAAESAMQGIPKRFPRLTIGSWTDNQTE